jgi:type 1 fimbria pilin
MKLTDACAGVARPFMRLARLVALMCLLLAAPAAHAQINCNQSVFSNYSPAVGTNVFGRDAPVGSTTQTYTNSIRFHCQQDPCCDRDIFLTFKAAPNTEVPGYPDVYPTNVAGVGVRFTISNGPGTSCRQLPLTIPDGYNKITCHQPPGAHEPGMDYNIDVGAQFVKTGPIGAADLLTMPSVSMTLNVNDDPRNWAWGNVFSGSASGGFTIGACSVNRPAVQVTMPAAWIKDLSEIGATTGATPFVLSLYCDAGVRVAMTLTDAVDPANRTSTLTLTPDSTARGVGYQISHDDVLVYYGPASAQAYVANQFFVSTTLTTGGPLLLPFSARYVRTGRIDGGSADALATFTMSYQ